MDHQESSNSLLNVNVPVALIGLALSVLFFSQIKSVNSATDTAKWQATNADKQIEAYKDARDKSDKAIKEREPLVAQSEDTQKKFTALMKDVDELARAGDEDAKKIILGYGIKVADNAPAADKPKGK